MSARARTSSPVDPAHVAVVAWSRAQRRLAGVNPDDKGAWARATLLYGEACAALHRIADSPAPQPAPTPEAPPQNEHPRGCYTARTPQHGALGGCDGDGHHVCRSCRCYEPPTVGPDSRPGHA